MAIKKLADNNELFKMAIIDEDRKRSAVLARKDAQAAAAAQAPQTASGPLSAQRAQGAVTAKQDPVNPQRGSSEGRMETEAGSRPGAKSTGAAALYQAALQKADAPAKMQQYRAYGRPAAGFKSGMSQEDQAAWEAIGAKYSAGDGSWNKDTNAFREDGNWSSYTDADGKINGWLYAADGIGGYAPVFGGKVGESGYQPGTVFYAPDGSAYTMGADGSLRLSGSVTWARYGEYTGPRDAGLHGTFKSSNGQTYDYDTASDETLRAHGYYRGNDGLVRIAGSGSPVSASLTAGLVTPEQGAAPEKSQSPGGSPAAPRQETPAPGPVPASRAQGYDYGAAPEWRGTAYELQRDEALNNARSMGWNGSEYEEMRDRALENALRPWEGTPYEQRRDEALAAAGEAWQGSAYGDRRDLSLARAENLRWDYDPDADPVWQAYQKQYRREGERAARGTLGEYAARTGGIPSSYAVTAASQAGDRYAAGLSDRLPQLYGDAYDRYLREYQRQMDLSDRYASYDDAAYSRWADRQGQSLELADRYDAYGREDYGRYQDASDRQLSAADRYQDYDRTAYSRYLDRYEQQLDATDRLDSYSAREYDRYRDRLAQWNADRDFRYGLERDAVNDARYEDELAYERAWNEEERAYSRDYRARRDAVLDSRADREWAQELTEYADSHSWKQSDWEQYMEEYGDRLSDQAWKWAYSKARDAAVKERR